MRLATITLAILLCGILFPAAAAPQTSTLPAQISDAEFWRIFTEFSDTVPGELSVGSAVRFVFRIKDFDPVRGFRRYFWKATPVRN